MFTPTQKDHIDFENLNFDHFNGLSIPMFLHKFAKYGSYPTEIVNVRSHACTYMVNLITEYTNGATVQPHSSIVGLFSAHPCM